MAGADFYPITHELPATYSARAAVVAEAIYDPTIELVLLDAGYGQSNIAAARGLTHDHYMHGTVDYTSEVLQYPETVAAKMCLSALRSMTDMKLREVLYQRAKQAKNSIAA